MRTQLDYKTIARATIITSVKALILKGVIPDILTNIQSSRPTTASAQCANKFQNITRRFDAHGKFFTNNLQSSKHKHAHPQHDLLVWPLQCFVNQTSNHFLTTNSTPTTRPIDSMTSGIDTKIDSNSLLNITFDHFIANTLNLYYLYARQHHLDWHPLVRHLDAIETK
jgi:hypothetical protein